MHFGATLAAKEFDEVAGTVIETGTPEENRALFISENPVLEAIGEASMKSNLAVPMASIPPRALNPGEQRYAYTLGLPILSISGAHLYFHTPRDQADNTTPELLDPVVRAFRDAIEALLQLDAATIRGANGIPEQLAPSTEPGTCLS